MPLDHYVSQVHLRNFYCPSCKHLHAIRKSDLKRFPPRSEDVCRIEDGSTNSYLRHDRAIEEFLKRVEPRYNVSLTKLREGTIDEECIYAIAGFAAYVASCAPSAIRIHTSHLKSVLETTATVLDRQGMFGKASEALSGKSITELLANGTVQFEVDGKYPQALGIQSIIQRVSIFGNSAWEILQNDQPGALFLTSDFPVAIEQRRDGIVNRLVPLAPDLAIRIIPDGSLSRAKPDLSFASFTFRHRRLSRKELIDVNRFIVQCAEEIIFSRDNVNWIETLVAKHRYCCVEAVTERIPHMDGFLTVGRQQIVERRTR
jgi:hypothetical protein